MIPSIAINLVCCAGVVALWLDLLQRRPLNRLEIRASWLALFLVLLLVGRSLNWMLPGPLTERLPLIPGFTIPLLVLITVEGILRQHAPAPVKFIAAASLVTGIIATFTGSARFEPVFTYVFAGFHAAIYAYCLVWLAFRKRRRISPGENRIADSFGITLLLILPLLVTDFPEIIDLPARLGAIGILSAAYVLVFIGSGRVSALAFVTTFVIMGLAVLTLLLITIAVLGLQEFDELLPYAGILVSIFLTLAILVRLVEGQGQQRRQDAADLLAHARTDTVSHFLKDALSVELVRGARTLSAQHLADYDLDAFREVFERRPVLTQAHLDGQDGHRPGKAVREQLSDLLVRTRSTHAIFLDTVPPRLVVASAPPFRDGDAITGYLRLVARMARLIHATHPAPSS